MNSRRHLLPLLAVLFAVAAVTSIYRVRIFEANDTTIALTFLIVSLIAGTYGAMEGISTSILSGICFNYFFLKPIGTFHIEKAQDWVAFSAFLITALTANHLSSLARRRSEESIALALDRARMAQELNKTEALKQSDQLKSAILASVSHDLRTPLTSINAAVENLLTPEVQWDESARTEFYSIIKEEVDRLSHLVQNLLEMARIEAGECHPLKEWGSISEMITNVLARCGDSLSNHEVRVRMPDVVPLVMWDERLIGQVLANLLENAAHYSAPGAEIILSVELEQDILLIRVKDSGPGIADDEIPRLFQSFYRGKAGTKSRVGTGMGLAIAQGIMIAHGGTIEIQSKVGVGSTFIIRIPAEMKADERAVLRNSNR